MHTAAQDTSSCRYECVGNKVPILEARDAFIDVAAEIFAIAANQGSSRADPASILAYKSYFKFPNDVGRCCAIHSTIWPRNSWTFVAAVAFGDCDDESEKAAMRGANARGVLTDQSGFQRSRCTSRLDGVNVGISLAMGFSN